MFLLKVIYSQLNHIIKTNRDTIDTHDPKRPNQRKWDTYTLTDFN